jgi:hypothetical protein
VTARCRRGAWPLESVIVLIIIGVVVLGGLVVSVLSSGLKVRGFKPSRGRLIFRALKSAARLYSEEN